MLFYKPLKDDKYDLQLLGAVQISGKSFFVYKNKSGNVVLKSGKEEKIQKAAVLKMIKLNPAVSKILERYRIKPTIDTKVLKELAGGHMNDTCKIAIAIFSNLPQYLKAGLNKENIKEASMLHDLGKVLIPSKVLNKPAKLNKKERKIMNIHSTLGYELLKTQNINKDTLNLVKYHHQNLKHSGYPVLKSEDKYS